MKKVFMCSLVKGGLLGGAIYVEPDSVTYKTNKLTVDKKYRNLVLLKKDIQEITWKRIVFPVATFRMANGEEYSVMIFDRAGFEKALG
jgi:hypothetical protein